MVKGKAARNAQQVSHSIYGLLRWTVKST